MSGEGIGSVVAEKCSPIHSSSKPSRSASSDFSVSSSSVLQNWRSGGWTGIMNIPRRMHFLPTDLVAATMTRRAIKGNGLRSRLAIPEAARRPSALKGNTDASI